MVEKWFYECTKYINTIEIMISNLKKTTTKKHVQYGPLSLKNLKCTCFIDCELIYPYYCIIANYPIGTFITTHEEIDSIEIERLFHFAQSKFVWIGLLPVNIWNVNISWLKWFWKIYLIFPSLVKYLFFLG